MTATNSGHFKPGQTANPAGRPKGARNKLGEDFISALQSDFREHGITVIEKIRDQRPREYLKIVARLTPRELRSRLDGVQINQTLAMV